MPGLADDVAALGAHLGWHGALSGDAILAADGPVWIHVNPRLVEQVNAARAGVDLLAPVHADPLTAVPVIAAAAACLLHPPWGRLFTAAGGSPLRSTP